MNCISVVLLLSAFSPLFVNSNVVADEPTDNAVQARKDRVIVLSIERMKNFDWRSKESVREAVLRHIRRSSGSPEFLELVEKFKPEGMENELWQLAESNPMDSTGVEAVELLLTSDNGRKLIKEKLNGDLTSLVPAGLLGLLGTTQAIDILRPLVVDLARGYESRAAAVKTMTTNNLGANTLLELAEQGELPGDVKLLAAGLLARSADPAIVVRAAELMPLPVSENQEPVPPVDQLSVMRGDVVRGAELFRTKATCANCHVVNGEGKQVGPDLSEIGDKLSREAMYVSILDPSAGISHNYENYICLTDSGQVISGILVSETEAAVVLRTPEAIDRRISMDELEELKKSEKSIMPENLHQAFDTQGLVDVVEFLMTLKKVNNSPAAPSTP